MRGSVVLAALVGLFGLAACGDADFFSEPVEVSRGDLDALAGASCPPRYEVLRSGEFSRAKIAAAKRGEFVINDQPVSLQPPVDWNTNPQNARAFSHGLFKFQWIDPLLYAYRTDGDLEALQQATELVLDFAAANPPNGAPVDPEVWGDKRSGDRGPYLAYVLRAAECEGLLEADDREALLTLMARHAAVLTDPELYKPTNHGLFVDLGLTLLARQLESQPEAEGWAELGRERFRETMGDRTVADEGLWLEHSAGYQILLSKTLARFLKVPGNRTPELTALLRRMNDVVGWLREPDGRIPQLGDSDLKEVPGYGDRQARDDRGILELDDSGLAVVKRGGGYLAVLASYFSDAHKHADALTFDLYDRGRRLITDTGLYHKDKDENFAFAHSERAHSVLTVDGEEFPRDGTGTYGSGIVQSGEGAGYSAILGTNPAVNEQNVEHERLFVYRPGRVLVIVDRLRSEETHRYVRFLQFAPGLDVRRRGAAELGLGAPGFAGTVRTSVLPKQRIELARGERDPLRGLTSPSFRRWRPRTTARFRDKAADANLVTTISLGGPPLEAELESWRDGEIRLGLRGGGSRQQLRISERGEDFVIEAPAGR